MWLIFASSLSLGIMIVLGVILVYYYREKQKILLSIVMEFDSKLAAVDKILANVQTTSSDLRKILDELEDLNVDFPDNPEILWRLGEAHYKISEKYSDDLNHRKQHIKRGIKTCERALVLRPKLSVAQKWLNVLFDADSKDENQASIFKLEGSRKEEDFPKIIANVDKQFEKISNHSEVCVTLLFLQTLDSRDYRENPEVLWRLGKAIYYVCLGLKSTDTIINNISKGIESCEKAIELNPELANAHKWLAILIGLRAEQRHFSSKFNDVILLKKHLNVALKLNPDDHYLYYMLGRYDYWLSGLSSFFDRETIALTFSDNPQPKYDDALGSLFKAEEINVESFKANRLMIGKCYMALKKYKEAIEWLVMAKDLPFRNYIESVEDSTINLEIESLLDQCKSHNVDQEGS